MLVKSDFFVLGNKIKTKTCRYTASRYVRLKPENWSVQIAPERTGRNSEEHMKGLYSNVKFNWVMSYIY